MCAAIERRLNRRPTIDDLRQHNILHDVHMAPGLAATALSLQKAQVASSLTRKIPNRPAKETLEEQNILKRADPGVAARLGELHRHQLTEQLDRHLIHRPGPLDLVQRSAPLSWLFGWLSSCLLTCLFASSFAAAVGLCVQRSHANAAVDARATVAGHLGGCGCCCGCLCDGVRHAVAQWRWRWCWQRFRRVFCLSVRPVCNQLGYESFRAVCTVRPTAPATGAASAARHSVVIAPQQPGAVQFGQRARAPPVSVCRCFCQQQQQWWQQSWSAFAVRVGVLPAGGDGGPACSNN